MESLLLVATTETMPLNGPTCASTRIPDFGQLAQRQRRSHLVIELGLYLVKLARYKLDSRAPCR